VQEGSAEHLAVVAAEVHLVEVELAAADLGTVDPGIDLGTVDLGIGPEVLAYQERSMANRLQR